MPSVISRWQSVETPGCEISTYDNAAACCVYWPRGTGAVVRASIRTRSCFGRLLAVNVRPILMPLPFAVWHALGWAGEFVPGAPVTRNQVELMEIDTVASPEKPGFATLGIEPQPMEQVLERILRAS
jgi:hypothetical protein